MFVRRAFVSALVVLAAVQQAGAQDIGGLLGTVIREIQRSDSQSMEGRRPDARRTETSRQRSSRRVDERWMVVASRTTEYDAVGLAETYVQTMGPIFVTETQNGRYAIVASFLDMAKAKENREALAAIRMVPADSFLTDGQSFRRVVWQSHDRTDFVELVHEPTVRQAVSRLQTALARLQLYSGAIDGAVGPGTAAAFKAYVSGYGPIDAEVLDDATLRAIESTASDGFRNDAERQLARNKGFSDSAAYQEAMAGGFEDYFSYRTAKNLGFSNRADYDGFKQSGFATKAQFDEARNEGFNTKAAADSQRRELLDAARMRAGLLLADAEDYLRLNPGVPGILEIVQQAAALKEAQAGRSYATIDERAGVLGASLAKIEGFSSFQEARAAERAKAEAQAVDKLRGQIAAKRNAMQIWVARNLTHSASPSLVQMLKTLDDEMPKANSTKLAEMLTSIDDLLSRAALTAPIDSIVADDSKPAEKSPDGDLTVEPTATNAFLLEGRGEEFVAIYNASPSAPSLVKNLAGNFVFDKRTANVCIYPDDPSRELRRAVATELDAFGAEQTMFVQGGCTEANVGSVDVVLVKRGDFLRSREPSLAIAVFKQIESGDLRRFDVMTDSALVAYQSQEKALRSTIALDVERNVRKGYGAFVVKGGDPAALCVVIEGDTAAHEALVAEVVSFIDSDGLGVLSPRSTDAESAYRAFQRRECSAVYATAETLKTLAGALARDGVATEYLPLWYDAEALKQEEQRRTAEQQTDMQQHEQRRVETEEAERIARKQQAENDAQIAVQTEKLRRQNAVKAKALETYLAERLRAFALDASPTVDSGSVGALSQEVGMLFPGFASWYHQSRGDYWKAEQVDVEIVEFGLALWKERRIGAIAIRADLNMVSPELGERKKQCFMFGLLDDEEFQMKRDPVEFDCSQQEYLTTWRTGHQLESLWHAQ